MKTLGQAGLIPLLVAILLLVVALIVFAFMRVQQAG
jgi:hypothetical protein